MRRGLGELLRVAHELAGAAHELGRLTKHLARLARGRIQRIERGAELLREKRQLALRLRACPRGHVDRTVGVACELPQFACGGRQLLDHLT